MARPGITQFISLTANAASSAAQNLVSGLAGDLRAGLQGSSKSTGPIEKQTSFAAKGKPFLYYPSDLGSDPRQANYILFTAYNVSNAKLKKVQELTGAEKIEATLDRFGPASVITLKQASDARLAAKVRKNANGNTSAMLRQRADLLTVGRTIGLYMPPQVTASYNMDYGEENIGAVGEVVFDIIKDVQAGFGGEEIFNRISAGNAPSALRDKAIGLVNTVLPGTRALAAIAQGSVITPKMELMFRGVGRRSFSFTFTFTPANRVDGMVAGEIIKEFKLRMHPEFIKAGIVREQTIPDIYEIAYWTTTGPNKNLNRIGKCFLEKVDVKYGGDKFQTFEAAPQAGAPVRTELTLQFREIEILDRTKIEDGF